MSTRVRGRGAPARRSRLPLLYLILGVIAVLGIVILVWVVNRDQTPPASEVPVESAVRPIDAPVGTTEDGFPYKGDPDAPVTVIEYSDFQCPACGAYFLRLGRFIDENYVETGRVQFVYHDFPLRSIHPNAVAAAEAARCAGEQDAFWPMHDLLFSRQNEWSSDGNVRPRFVSYAEDLELDVSAFEQCMEENRYADEVNAAADAAEAAGIQATPTFVVNGKQVDSGELQAAIDEALQAVGE